MPFSTTMSSGPGTSRKPAAPNATSNVTGNRSEAARSQSSVTGRGMGGISGRASPRPVAELRLDVVAGVADEVVAAVGQAGDDVAGAVREPLHAPLDVGGSYHRVDVADEEANPAVAGLDG